MAKTDEKRAAQEFGQRAASRGGKARANVLSAEERRRIAKDAARARWAKDDENVVGEDHDLLAPLTEATVTATSDKPYSMFRARSPSVMSSFNATCSTMADGCSRSARL